MDRSGFAPALTCLTLLPILLPVSALAAPAVPAATDPRRGGGVGGPDACELQLDPARIPVREAAVLVTVRASADPGAIHGVEVPGRSGVVVLKAAPADGSGPVVARMALDTSRANEGRWSVVLRGEAVDCRGRFEIRAGPGEAGSR